MREKIKIEIGTSDRSLLVGLYCWESKSSENQQFGAPRMTKVKGVRKNTGRLGVGVGVGVGRECWVVVGKRLEREIEKIYGGENGGKDESIDPSRS